MFGFRSGNLSSNGSFGFRFARRNLKAESTEINGRGHIYSVGFLADGKHIVSGGEEGKIRRWRVKDGSEVGRPMNAGGPVCSIAVSRDAKWIVSGTSSGLGTVWDAKSRKAVVALRRHSDWVCAVDISPDGLRVATGSKDRTARVWSLSTGARLLGPWEHDSALSGIRFSPDGLLIATATWLGLPTDSIRIYDSQNGDHHVNVPIGVIYSYFNEALAWSCDSKQLFVLSYGGYVCCLDASAGTILSRWSIPGSGKSNARCISLARDGKFIAASSASSASFWDTMTHEQIGSVVQHTVHIDSMAISAHFDLVVGGGETVTLCSLRDILPSHYFDAISEPATQHIEIEKVNPEECLSTSIGILHPIHASDAVLESWKRDKLLEAINIVSKEKLRDQRHHALATRAFLRARLRQWDSAIKDAQKSITVQPTILAYIAISMAHFGRGNVNTAKKVFNRLFLKCDVDDICFVTLIKAIIMFIFGHHQEGMAGVADLIDVCPKQDASFYRIVQAYMHLTAAKVCVSRREYDKALELLADLQDPQFPNHPQLQCISLMFGWTFDSDVFTFTLYQHRCEALYALGRQKEAAELLGMVLKYLVQQSESRQEVKEWLRDFERRL